MEVHNHGELSPGEVNQKRKQLTFEVFRQQHFLDKLRMLEFFIGPFTIMSQKLLLRSGHISTLHHLPDKNDASHQELMTRQVMYVTSCDFSPIDTRP